MNTWKKRFLNEHGDRLVFGGISLFLGFSFIGLGILFEPIKSLTGAGTSLVIGVGMLAYNKCRSPKSNGNDGVEPKPD